MTKYTWVVSLKDKKSITIANAFQTFFEKSSLKPNKLWADKKVNFTIYQRNLGDKIMI